MEGKRALPSSPSSSSAPAPLPNPQIQSAFELLPVHHLINHCLQIPDKLTLAESSQRCLQFYRLDSTHLKLNTKTRPCDFEAVIEQVQKMNQIKSRMHSMPEEEFMAAWSVISEEMDARSDHEKTVYPLEAQALLSLLFKQKRLTHLKAPTHREIREGIPDLIAQALRLGYLPGLKSLVAPWSPALMEALNEGHAPHLAELVTNIEGKQHSFKHPFSYPRYPGPIHLQLTGLTRLQELTIYDMIVALDGEWPSTLSKLALRPGCKLEEAAFKSLTRMLEGVGRDHLESLVLWDVDAKPDIGGLGRALTSGPWPRLRSLEIKGDPLNNAIAAAIRSDHFPQLTNLACVFSPALMASLTTTVEGGGLSHLQELNIHGNYKKDHKPFTLVDRQTIHLGATGPFPPLLYRLELHNQMVSFPTVSYGLPPNITTLAMIGCPLGDQGVVELITALDKSGADHHLQSLQLNGCDVGEGGVRALAAVLQTGGWPSLKLLELSGNEREEEEQEEEEEGGGIYYRWYRLFSKEGETVLRESLVASGREKQVDLAIRDSVDYDVEIPETPGDLAQG